MTRYVFKAIDIGASMVFLALCTKAFCIHFYEDIERRLHALKLPTIKDTPSPIPSEEIAITQLPTAALRLGSHHQHPPSSY
jgi:hypothetical protein